MPPTSTISQIITPCLRRTGQSVQKSLKVSSLICQSRSICRKSTHATPPAWRSRIPHWTLSASRRSFTLSAAKNHGHLETPQAGEELHVTFIDKEGEEHTFTVAKGDNLLDIAQANDLEMEGACGGSCACSTCHVIVEDAALYDKMDESSGDEDDMLDLAFGLTETSRLGCQVKMTADLNGLRVRLPPMTRNLQASDFGKKAGAK